MQSSARLLEEAPLIHKTSVDLLANSRTKVAAPVTNVETMMGRLGPYTVDGLAAVLILVMLALSASSRRVTGDGQEYLLMAQRLASGQRPAVPIEIAKQAGVYDSRLIDRQGQQEMWHFWFFPLCVVPVLAVTTAMGGSPLWAFAIFNAILLWIGVVIVRRRFGVLAAIFVGLSPIIWWIDKPQVEVFTFIWLLLGCVALPSPSRTALCFAIAATQNPPIGALVVAVATAAVWRRAVRLKDVWVWALAFGVLAMHPLYYWAELGRATPLVEASDLRWPAWRTFATPLVDLNVGLIVNAPMLACAMAWGLAAALRGREHRTRALFGIATCLLFLFAFAQAPNVNSGGTPGMSRYALWLIPPFAFAISLFRFPPWRRAVFTGMVVLSAGWSVVCFRPTAPENYLEPTPLAFYVWSHYPAAENPLPEIFAERLRHRDGVNTLASTPNCAKALLQDGVWPDPCEPVGELPVECRIQGTLCYANRRTDGSYAFVPTSRRGGINLADLFR